MQIKTGLAEALLILKNKNHDKDCRSKEEEININESLSEKEALL
jgi:hypothetical protein